MSDARTLTQTGDAKASNSLCATPPKMMIDPRSRVTLMERIPPTDVGKIGWDVISRQGWIQLSKLLDLPGEARLPLVNILVACRVKRKASGTQTPSEIRKDLERLRKLTNKLRDQFQALERRTGTYSALMIAMQEEHNFRAPHLHALSRAEAMREELRANIATVERWRGRFGRAAQVAKGWKDRSGKNRELRPLVAELDQLVHQYTGKGLVRSEHKSDSRGRGAACGEFVSEIVRLAIGRQKDSTINEAIKDVIAHRRRLGRSR